MKMAPDSLQSNMLKSYLTIALRSLRRNKVTSLINIAGLMLGLTTGIIICLVLLYVFRLDNFHKDYKHIHLVEMNERVAGTVYTGNQTPGPLGPAIKEGVAGVKRVVRTATESQALTRYAETAIYQKGIYAEPDFFNMMTFPPVEGNAAATLADGSGAVLTQTAARRLFGAQPALGKTILLNNSYPLKVGAVIKDVPQNTSVEFDIVLPFTLQQKENGWLNRWDKRTVQTWVQLQPGANLDAVNRQMTQLLLSNSNLTHVSVFAYPIARLALYDNFKDGKPFWGKAYLFMFIAFVAFLTLLIACINFMNLSTAMAEHRAREVGLRKVLGAPRRVIIVQFLGEAVLLAMIALLLSVGAAYLILPVFAGFSQLPLSNEFSNPGVWVLFLFIGLITGLIAGSYPALYLSRFQPVKVLKRLMSVGRRGPLLRKGLVAVQFFISIFLVIMTITLVRQAHYLENRPLGFEPSNLIDITADGTLPAKFELFKAKAETIPGVVNVTAGTDNLIRFGSTETGVDWPGKLPDQDFIFQTTWVQYDWTKTAGLSLAEGRDFSPAFGADTSACLVNQAAVFKMGLKEPVLGASVGGKRVIGVLRDFVINSPGKAAQPLIVYLSKKNLTHFLVRLTNDGQWKTHLSQIEAAVKELNDGYPFTFRFTDDEHQEFFKNDFGTEQLSNIFALLAILISCMGLFGLSGFVVERRMKEISIRKVLGASPAGLWYSLTKEMLKPVFIAIAAAIPLAVLALAPVLNLVDYHISLSWWFFVVAGGGAIIVALLTVSYYGIRATRINPARLLQTE